jgi:chromosome segregation ATPase
MQLQAKSYAFQQLQAEIRDSQAMHDTELADQRTSNSTLKKQVHTQRLSLQEAEQQRDVALQELTKLKSLREQQRQILEDAQEALRLKEGQILTVRKEVQELRALSEESVVTVSNLELQLSRATSSLQEARNQLQDAEAATERQRKEINEARAKAVLAETQVSDMGLAVHSKALLAQQLQAEIKEVQNKHEVDIAALNTTLTKSQSTLSLTRTELEEAERAKERQLQEINELRGRIKALEGAHEHSGESTRSLEAKMGQLRRHVQEAKVAQQEAEQQRDSSNQDVNKYKGILQQAQRQVEDLQDTLRQKDTVIIALRKDLVDAKSLLDESVGTRETVDMQLSKTTTLVSEMRIQLQDLEENADRLRKEITDLRSKVSGLEQANNELNSQVAAKQRQISQCHSDTKDAASRHDADLTDVRNQVATQKRQIQDLRVHKEEAEHQREVTLQELTKIKSVRDTIRSELDEKLADVERLTKEVAKLSIALSQCEKERDDARHNTVEACRIGDEEVTLHREQIKVFEEALERARNTALGSNRTVQNKVSDTMRYCESTA